MEKFLCEKLKCVCFQESRVKTNRCASSGSAPLFSTIAHQPRIPFSIYRNSEGMPAIFPSLAVGLLFGNAKSL